MSLPLLLLAAALTAQGGSEQANPPTPQAASAPRANAPTAQDKPTAGAPAEEIPPEEDEALKPKDYAFNPVQAKREVRTGDFYMKRGKYKAAAARYLEATRWNSQMAEAYLKLGEAEQKQDEPKLARDAYQRFLDMNPNAKQAGEVRKRMEKLPAS